MTAYVLCHLTYDSSNKQKPTIQSINMELIDSSLSNIKDELVQISANWIRDEIGKNNYQETLDDTRSLNDLPDGLVRRYAFSELDKKDINGEINRQVSGNVIKQINIFRKTTMNGTIYGKWSELELVRSYFISKANCQNFGYNMTMPVAKTVENVGQTTGYDDVITQLKNFSRANLRSLAKQYEHKETLTYETNNFQDAFEPESSPDSSPESSDNESSSSESSDNEDDSSSSWDSDEEAANKELGYEIVDNIPPPPPLPMFKLPHILTDDEKARKKIV